MSIAKNVAISTAGAVAGFAGTLGLTSVVAKKTGKALGAYGSPAHIATNPNLTSEDRVEITKTLAKENIKDTGKLALGTGVAAGAAAVYAGVSKGAQGKLSQFISKAGSALDEISIGGTSVKETIKNSGIGKKFLNATPAAKAAILAGAAVLTAGTALLTVTSASKAGYVEGSHESK